MLSSERLLHYEQPYTFEEIQGQVLNLKKYINSTTARNLETHRTLEYDIFHNFFTKPNIPADQLNRFIELKERHYEYEHSVRGVKHTLAIFKCEIRNMNLPSEYTQYTSTLSEIESLEEKVQDYLVTNHSTSCPQHGYNDTKIENINTESELEDIKARKNEEYRYLQEHKMYTEPRGP
ncbi:hypothetical protein BDA99DRAFT_539058 [Phascolomyces articulosus]|uniref:Uncharacterized protein n=1 Tax=Phascolomyces articulosus TaxID=60185 RepID=A0AAD5PC53_9FUNG|nr:hypothetical protein BDA99DRAFT_539058 [Phascolomyces articulosus]